MSRIKTIFERLSDHIPLPETELNYTNSYTLLVAVVLSAQSTDKGVNKATKELFKTVNTPSEMIDLGLERLKSLVKTIGLFNTKASNIIKLSQLLLNEHQGEIPQNRSQLMTLPGVGQKTANVVLNVAFGQPTIPVDTHVARLANRLGLSKETHPNKIETDLESKIPKEFLKSAHHLMILHGRYTCKARSPLCKNCFISDLCNFTLKDAVKFRA